MKQQASRQSVKDFKLIADAYFRLLSAYKKDGEFLFRLSRKELLILGFDKIEDFRGEWVIDDADKWYEPSDWEHVQCLANWDKPAFDKENPVFYRDDLCFCDGPIQPIPGEKEIESLWVFEDASALCDAICGWLRRQSGLLEDKFIGWPGTAFFEGYFPQCQSQIERYTLNDITKNKSEYLSRLQSMQDVGEKPASDRTDGAGFRFIKDGKDVAEVFYNEIRLPIPAGRSTEILFLLVERMPGSVSYDDLGGKGITGGASEQLRNEKSKLDHIIKKHTPFKIESATGYGYRLAPIQ